jgi:hypothetical protein
MRTISRLAAFLGSILMLSSAGAAPPAASSEDRYIAARDAAIEKSSMLYDAGKFDDGAQKAEDATRGELQAQMSAMLAESNRAGFGPATLNLDTFYKGDQGFGMLDGLRFDAETGKSGERAGSNGADGKYVEPKAHIIVTTERLFARWLRAHKDWWDKGLKNVPQQIDAALKFEGFYTQAISTDSAVINFNALPIARPASATLPTPSWRAAPNPTSPMRRTRFSFRPRSTGRCMSPTVRSNLQSRFRHARPSGPASTNGRKKPTTSFASTRSTGRHTTSSATSVSRAKTPSSAVSPSALRSKPRSPWP